MNTVSASPVDPAAGERKQRRILVWDAPVRVFHWLMVLSFAGAYLSAESERWRLAHVTLGYTMAGLVGFRILWGLLGTRHARFASFVRGPAAVGSYLKSLLQRRPEHHTGHNPAGALAIMALLLMTLAVTASGWASYQELGGEWLEELHEVLANLMLGVVALHIAGVVAGSWLHRENLVTAMFTGRKDGPPEQGVGALMLAAVLGFWWLQWQGAPAADAAGGNQAAAQATGHDDDD
jgi:cytochrome b